MMAMLDWQLEQVQYDDDVVDWLDRDYINDDMYEDYAYSVVPDGVLLNGHTFSQIDIDDEGNIVGVIAHDV